MMPIERAEPAIVRKGANGEDGYSGFTMRDPQTGETIQIKAKRVVKFRVGTGAEADTLVFNLKL